MIYYICWVTVGISIIGAGFTQTKSMTMNNVQDPGSRQTSISENYDKIEAFNSLSSIESLKSPDLSSRINLNVSNKAAWFFSETHRDKMATEKSMPLPRRSVTSSIMSFGNRGNSCKSSSASKYEVDAFSKTYPDPKCNRANRSAKSGRLGRSASEEVMKRPWEIKQNNWFTGNAGAQRGVSAMPMVSG